MEDDLVEKLDPGQPATEEAIINITCEEDAGKEFNRTVCFQV